MDTGFSTCRLSGTSNEHNPTMMNTKHFFLHTFLCAVLLCCASASLTAQEKQQAELSRLDSLMARLSDNTLSLDEKQQLVAAEFDTYQTEDLMIILNKLLQIVKKAGDDEKVITGYSNLMLLYAQKFDFQNGQLYLDSALMYTDKVSDLGLAKLHYAAGYFYGSQDKPTLSHEHFYKAIDHFDKAGDFESWQVSLLVAIGKDYARQNDTVNTRLIVEEIQPIMKSVDDPVTLMETYMLMGDYYGALYDTQETAHYLDSIIAYKRKFIDTFIDTYKEIDNPPDNQSRIAALHYLILAQYLLETPDVDVKQVKHLLEEGKRISFDDFELFYYYHMGYARYYLKLHDHNRALEEAEKILETLQQTGSDEYHAMYAGAYETLADIHEANGSYSQALKYRKLEMEYYEKAVNEKQHATLQNMRTRYDVEKKEQSIRQLTERNAYQNKIKNLYIGIIILILALLFFIVTWFRNKRKADAALLNMAQLKQQEAELKTELETAKREEREREYQTLLNETQQHQLKSYLSGLESERSRLARELHDSVSNELVAVHMKIEQDHFDKDNLKDTLRSLHTQVRGISHALMPPAFSYAALSDILEDYTGRQQEHRRENIQLSIEKETEWNALPASVALNVYRIVQEAVTNALKHADATNIFIRLEKQEDEFRLLIVDDGEGFDTRTNTNGIGLKTIRERAEDLSGQFTIVSETGKGTEIEVRFPG